MNKNMEEFGKWGAGRLMQLMEENAVLKAEVARLEKKVASTQSAFDCGVSFHDLAIKERDLARIQVERLKAENERLMNAHKTLGSIIHRNTAAMQAAWIEWKHGDGAEEAMQWIENTLDGPDLIPDEDELHSKNAQAYFDAAMETK